MIIERLMKDAAIMTAKIFLNKEEKKTELIEFSQMKSEDLFKLLLDRLYHQGDFNNAENLIFDELNKNPSNKIYQISVDFYNKLLKKNDEELTINNFSKEEVYQGIEDIKKFIPD